MVHEALKYECLTCTLRPPLQVVTSDPALLSLVAGLHHHQARHVVLTATIIAIQVVAPPPAEEQQPPDSAVYSQMSQSAGVAIDSITDETWDGSIHPTTEVGMWDVTSSQAPCSTWNVKLLTEEKMVVVNTHFAPLPADHWMVWTSLSQKAANPHLSMLSCGVCTSGAELTDTLSRARGPLLQVPFSCLLSLYQPGGGDAVQATLLRAFPLR